MGSTARHRSGLAMIVLCATTVLAGVVEPASANAAAAPVSLGTAANFAVLAASTVTNTGATTLTGDLGLSPGTSVTGFPPGQVIGTVHAADSVAAQAQVDLTAAYDDAAARPTTATVAVELGGTIRAPGVYDSPAGTFGITGTLVLDAQGDPNAVFVFKAASTLITASNSNVDLVNGARSSNVFWQVGSSATLGTGSTLRGNVLAMASITLTTGVTVVGRALARTGAVTLDNNTVAREPQLSITVPVSANLGSAAPGGTVTGHLGSVTVNADGVASWTVTVSTTDFTAGGGAPPIANSGVSYWSGPATAQTGTGTATPAQPTAAQAQNLGAPRTAMTLQSGGTVTAVTWNPTLIVSVPSSAIAGVHTATVTHSVV